MPDRLPAITGKQLIRLFADAGSTKGRKNLHGVAFRKRFPDRVRVTTIPDKRSSLPSGTVAAILGPKQSGIGRAGLVDLIAQFGLR